MILAHKIALDPTVKQRIAFARAAGVARFTWNWALAEYERQRKAGKKPTALKLKKQWNSIKGEQFPWVYDSPKGANQQPFANLQKAFQSFFKKTTKRPTFKKKGQHDSFYIENDKFKLDGAVAVLSKIGRVQLREKLRFNGRIMGAVVSRTADRWFISIQVDVGETQRLRLGSDVVGIDLGVKTAVTFSTGEKLPGPKPLKKAIQKVRHYNRIVSRRQKGSRRREKSKRRLARLHYRTSNIRKDFLDKLTTRLCRENQTIVIEDLNVRGMVKNHHLARSVSDIGFFEFRRQLEYKSPMHDVRLVIADQWFPSSKTCSGCGQVKPHLSLSEREYECIHCGLVIDRDVNAAINLRTLGLRGTYAQGEAMAASNLVELRTKPCTLVYTS